MAQISDLSEELLVKILSFLPTRDAVSTSVLSKQWKFLWMWCPDLDFSCNKDSVRDFINKNLPLHKAPIIKRLSLEFSDGQYQADDYKTWVGIALSRGLLELSINYVSDFNEIDAVFLFLPSSLYICNSLVTLDLYGKMVLVDVPPKVCLPSLKRMKLSRVTYSNQDSLRLLLCCCPVLEYLLIDRDEYDNLRELVIRVTSLQCLFLIVDQGCSDDVCVIVTPSLKYFKLQERRYKCSYLIEHMPDLEVADICVLTDSCLDNLLKSISNVETLALSVSLNSGYETVYGDGIIFNMLEGLVVLICSDNWSKITVQLLKDSPNLQVLYVSSGPFRVERFGEYERGWIYNLNVVPECLLKSLKIFDFESSTEEEEEKDFLCFITNHACCLESTRIG